MISTERFTDFEKLKFAYDGLDLGQSFNPTASKTIHDSKRSKSTRK
jgi:hypothetical protein